MRYNEKNASELLTIDNFPSNDTSALMHHLELISEQNERIKNAVFHVTVPFPPDEVLNDQTYIDIARDYMQGMGYGEQPYAVFLHTDKAHLHLHIVSSRVATKDFRKIDDCYERWRSQCVGAIIERKHGITSVLDEKLPQSLSRIVNSYFEQAQNGVEMNIGAYFEGWRKLLDVHTLRNREEKKIWQKKPTPEVSNKVLLHINSIVTDAMSKKPCSLAELKKILEAQRVEIKEVVNRQTGKRQGVVFVLHRQDVKEPTIEVAERGIPSGQLPCFSEMPLMRQLYANRREYKAAQAYIRKQLVNALKKAKSQEELQEMLQKQNILTTWHTNARGVYGVSFTYKDTTLKGVQMGKQFSFEKIAVILEQNRAAVEVAVPAATPLQEQAFPQHFGSIGGSGGSSSKDEDDEDDEEEDEVTGQKVKRRKKQ
jgi:hypothetical protein